MAVNPMQRKARNSFLIGVIVTLLITGIIIVLLFIQLKKKDDELKIEIGEKREVYVLNQDVKSGQILTEDMFERMPININEIPSNATTLSEVVDSWFLQTQDGKVLYRDEMGLYIREPDTIIELYYNNGQYYNQSDDSSVSLRGDPFEDTVDGETRYFATDTSNDEITRVYEDLNTGNCYVYKIENNTISKVYLKFNSVPLLSKIDLKKNTVMTRDYVVQSDAVLTNDVRKQEYNMIVLPMDLLTDDYVDIRLMLPNGQNFIVISKTQVEIPLQGDGVTYVPDTIWMELREDEILALSSAIVEAYGINGAYLYANKYVEPGIQEASAPDYTPNEAVTRQLDTNNDGIVDNPNVVSEAMEELATRYSENMKNIRNQYLQTQINNENSYGANVQAGMDESVTNSQATREEYLESLNY